MTNMYMNMCIYIIIYTLYVVYLYMYLYYIFHVYLFVYITTYTKLETLILHKAGVHERLLLLLRPVVEIYELYSHCQEVSQQADLASNVVHSCVANQMLGQQVDPTFYNDYNS